MKATINYVELRILETDIRRMQGSPALNLFLRKYIQAFYNKNEQRLKVLIEKSTTLVEKYVKHAEGVPVTKKDDKGVELYVFADDESETAYKKEMTEFLALTFEIEV